MAEQRGRPFQPGNKFGRGRPPGSRNKEKIDAGKMLEQFEPHLVAKCISMALEGNIPAMKICMSQLFAAAGRRVKIALGELCTPQDVKEAFVQIAQAAAEGKMTLPQAESLSHVLDDLLSGWEKSNNMNTMNTIFPGF